MLILIEILKDGLTAARKLGVNYAEIRATAVKREHIQVSDGQSFQRNQADGGVAVRLLVAGYWGFAAAPVADKGKLRSLVDKAFANARAAAAIGRRPVFLSSAISQRGVYQTPVERDPFAVSAEEKRALLMTVDRALAQKDIARRRAWLDFRREHKTLVTSVGTVVEQTIVNSGGGFSILARTERGSQVRSWPGPQGAWFGGGYEKIAAMDMPGHTRAIADEAVALCGMPPCPRGVFDLVLTGHMLALLLHATWGFHLELDNFLAQPGKGRRQVEEPLAAPCINLVSDATLPGGAGAYGFDDEGVRAQSTILIQAGVPTGFLAGRETSARIGKFSSGSMRASGWDVPPLVRAANLSLQPGHGSMSDLISQVDRGILLDTAACLSFESRRNRFRFLAESGRLIQGGRLTGLVPMPECTATTGDFWHSCAAVAGPEEWELWGLEQAKGAPQQVLPVGAGVAPALFRKVKAGGLQ